MYTPPNAVNLKDITIKPQIRLGIQGPPKSGKTYAATTFPNPLFLNFDRGLGAHAGKDGIHELPIWDAEFMKKQALKSRKDFLMNWLQTEALKMQPDQTLILDGSTGIQNAFDKWSEENPVYGRTGKIDDFAHWRLKVDYFAELCESLKALKCHVIYICHETVDRNDKGELNGKVRPLLSGQFGDQLASHMTDWMRQHAVEKPKNFDNLKPETLANWKLSSPEFKLMVESFTNTSSLFFWQTSPDTVCNCGSSSLLNPPMFIPARFTDFTKYTAKSTGDTTV